MYKRMIEEGFTANATTYNALISAYGKAGQLDKVIPILLETFVELLFSIATIPSRVYLLEK